MYLLDRLRLNMASPSRTIYAVLGFLTVRPMSGYDIKKAVEVSIANFWTESYGQIYPVLKRLTEQGLVEKSDTETKRQAPAPRVLDNRAGPQILAGLAADTGRRRPRCG